MKTFNTYDRVRFNLDETEKYKGTGTVLGKAVDNGLNDIYIVLLDQEIDGVKGANILSSLMEKI